MVGIEETFEDLGVDTLVKGMYDASLRRSFIKPQDLVQLQAAIPASSKMEENMGRCLNCECAVVRDYKCPHDCDLCGDCNP